MGAVFLGRYATEGFTKWVAVKTIHPHIAAEGSFLKMFGKEARLSALLNHPNICQVFDFGEDSGTHYLVMEYLHGETLQGVIKSAWKNGGMPLGIAARIIADAARALHFAHELRTPEGDNAQVVHRDVSPQNIFVLYEGSSKVVDFGVAKWNDALSESTRTDTLKGKLSYMPPEQLNGATLDRRVDLWALGVVLWESLVGKRLFKGANEADTFRLVLQAEIPRPDAARPDIPATLATIVMRALDRDRDRRYQTAAELQKDLERWVALEGGMVGHLEVSEFMKRLFAEQIRERETLLKNTQSADSTGSGVRPVGPSTIDDAVQNDHTAINNGDKSGATGFATTTSRRAQGEARSRGLLYAGGALLLVLGAGLAVRFFPRGTSAATQLPAPPANVLPPALPVPTPPPAVQAPALPSLAQVVDAAATPLPPPPPSNAAQRQPPPTPVGHPRVPPPVGNPVRHPPVVGAPPPPPAPASPPPSSPRPPPNGLRPMTGDDLGGPGH